jgi:hypothetical protein
MKGQNCVSLTSMSRTPAMSGLFIVGSIGMLDGPLL